MRRLKPGPLCLLAIVLLWATVAAAAPKDPWTRLEVKCGPVMAHPKKADSEQLEVCLDAFNTDARMHLMSATVKDDAEKSLRHLYDKGSDRGALIARDGLVRFGVKVPLRPERGSEPAAAVAKRRIKYNPETAAKSKQNAAVTLAKRGVADLSRNRDAKAEKTLTAAIGLDGRCEYCIYNLACAEAKQKKKAQTFEHLQWLSDLGTDDAIERLIKARTDADFRKVREEPDFKRITGYAKIRVVNTIAEAGEEGVKNIEIMLKEMGHARPDTDEKGKKQDFPQVQFKPYAKAQTLVITQLLNHPRVRMDPMKGDSKYDIVIVWGAKVTNEGGKLKVESVGPKTVDGKMSAARAAQNKVLAKPDQAINKVNRIVDTPERTYKSVESMGKRVEGTFNKGKGLVDKVGGIPDKITSL